MKRLLFLALLLAGLPCAAQAQIMGKSVPEYTTRRGTIIHRGDTLRFGLGTDPGGNFKYCTYPPNLFVGTPATPFNAHYANQQLVVKDLRLQNMNKRMAARTLAVVNPGGLNASVDLDAAEEAGEIHTAHNAVSQPVAAGRVSIADELQKLKGLLDTHVLTQAEYDAQKAKLLK